MIMLLTVHRDPDTIDFNVVSVAEVPADFTDSDVKWNVEQLAAQGDRVAREALRVVGTGLWIDLCYPRRTDGVRVYVDR